MHLPKLCTILVPAFFTPLITAIPTIVSVAGAKIPSSVLTKRAVSANETINLSGGKYCGELPVFEGGEITPMYTSNRCTNADQFEHFEEVHNGYCGFCVVWKNRDCQGPIMWWGGPTGQRGQTFHLWTGQQSETTPENDRGGQSYFCQ